MQHNIVLLPKINLIKLKIISSLFFKIHFFSVKALKEKKYKMHISLFHEKEKLMVIGKNKPRILTNVLVTLN